MTEILGEILQRSASSHDVFEAVDAALQCLAVGSLQSDEGSLASDFDFYDTGVGEAFVFRVPVPG